MGSPDNSNKPIGDTEDQVEQAKINRELWQHYQENYQPMLERYAAKVTSPGTQREEELKVVGQIHGEMMKNVSPAKTEVNPVQNTKRLMDLSTLEAGTQAQGLGKVREKQLMDVQNLIDIGRGDTTEAAAGLDTLAASSVSSQLKDLELQQQKDAAIENSYGSLAGVVRAGVVKLLNKDKTAK